MLAKITLFLTLVIALALTTFALNITTMGLDESLMSTYLAEDESKNSEIRKVIDDFIYNYIKPEMTDFEKEMMIIKYLVATTTYAEEEEYNDSPSINDSYKAYGALVKHRATCSGYAKAFDLIAKTCGLSTNVVTGTARNTKNVEAAHAWNQIYLDGDWYNVDVTWEDPASNVEVGFNQLFNNYINGTDAEFSVNHFRENGHTCTATKYGKNTVAYYLNTGIVDLNANVDLIRKQYEQEISIYSLLNDENGKKSAIDKLILLGAKYDNNSNFLASNNDMEITNYILSHLALGENVITVVTGPNTQNKFSIDSGNWLNNYITIPGRISMQRVFSTDGKLDTRILIFKFG